MASITGTASADALVDTAGNDTIDGLGGDDSLTVSLGGIDTVYGRDGVDTLVVDYSAATLAIATAASPVANGIAGGYDGQYSQAGGARAVTYSSIERFVISTGSAADTIVTARGNDILSGGAGDDQLNAGAGHDRLDGGTGFDRMTGGTGNDLYIVDNGDLAIESAGQGIDRVETALGAHFLAANVENLSAKGFQQLLAGNALNNFIVGSGGADTLRGAGGDDLVVGAAGGDTLEGGDGRDLVVASALDPANLIVNGSFETVSGSDVASEWIYNGGGNSYGTAHKQTATLFGWQKSGTADFELIAYGSNDGFNTGDGDVVVDMETWGGQNQSIHQDISGLAAGTMLVVGFSAARFIGDASPAVLEVLWNGELVATVVPASTDMTQYSFLVTAAAAGTGAGGANRIEFREAGTEAEGRGTMLDAITLNAVLQGVDSSNNRLLGEAGDDILVGDAGQDEFHGGAGNDLMIGGGNDDKYFVDDLGDIVVEKAGGGTFDQIITTLASYTLADHFEDLGGVLSTGQTLIGNGVYNRIQGGTGNDRIDGGGAGDFLAGGQGDDTFVISDTLDILFEMAGQGSDTIETDLAEFSLAGYNNIENILGTSAAGQVLTGSSGANRIQGAGGSDFLIGNGGADILAGGDGSDIYLVDSLDDAVEEGAGKGAADEVRTALGSRSDFAQMYTLAANVEKLTGTSASAQGVYANGQDNVVRMGAGGDLVVLDAGGADSVDGGGGNDFLYYGGSLTAADSNVGGAGFDTVGLLGTYNLTLGAASLVGIEKLAVYSSGAPAAPNNYTLATVDANVAAGAQLMVVAQSLGAGESLVFNGQAETNGSFNIRGGKGGDTIVGGLGRDLVWGNLGADTLKGGGGNDTFEYASVAESTAAARDTIVDFGWGDRLHLAGIDADGNGANGDTAFAFIGAAAFSGAAGQLRAVQANGGWLVEADVNGDSLADLVIALATPAAYTPSAADFVL